MCACVLCCKAGPVFVRRCSRCWLLNLTICVILLQSSAMFTFLVNQLKLYLPSPALSAGVEEHIRADQLEYVWYDFVLIFILLFRQGISIHFEQQYPSKGYTLPIYQRASLTGHQRHCYHRRTHLQCIDRCCLSCGCQIVSEMLIEWLMDWSLSSSSSSPSSHSFIDKLTKRNLNIRSYNSWKSNGSK